MFSTGAVRANSLTAKATDVSIESEIKEWLKFAKERDGGRKLREQKKRRQRAEDGGNAVDELDAV